MPQRRPGEKWRYIAFRIEGEATFARSDFLTAVLGASRGTRLGDSFRITVFEGNFGILKVPHVLKDPAISALSAIASIGGVPCKVETLRTSGTIRTLKEKYSTFIGTDQDEY